MRVFHADLCGDRAALEDKLNQIEKTDRCQVVGVTQASTIHGCPYTVVWFEERT